MVNYSSHDMTKKEAKEFLLLRKIPTDQIDELLERLIDAKVRVLRHHAVSPRFIYATVADLEVQIDTESEFLDECFFIHQVQ